MSIGAAKDLAEAIDAELRDRSSAIRAKKEKAYLKSGLDHYGVSVPDTRAVVRAALRRQRLNHDAVVALAEDLWAAPRASIDSPRIPNEAVPVHERRAAATMVLIQAKDYLGAGDLHVIEGFLRQARTWALVDPLAGDLVGPLSERDTGLDAVLERWARDEDLWIRRSALLAHLLPLRQGRGDFARFARFADEMLEEREFFIRKAIGWVLRDTSRKRPGLVFEWILPRAHRASGVTIREAIKRMSAEQQEAVLAAR